MHSTAGVWPRRRTVAPTVRALALPVALLAAVGCGNQDGLTPTSPDFASAPTTPTLSISPSSDPVVFGPVSAPFQNSLPEYVATPTTVTFTVTNVGTKSSGRISVSITGAGAAAYSIKKGDNGCASLGTSSSNNSCTVKVTFAPLAMGTYLATLNVNTPQSKPAASVNISGEGVTKFTINQTVQGQDVSMGYSMAGGLSPTSFQLSDGGTQAYTGVTPGTYTLTYTIPAGYALVTGGPTNCQGQWLDGNFSWDTQTGTIVITLREASQDFITCTFVLTQVT